MAIPAAWRALGDEIEAAVGSRMASATTRQETYRAAHGRYWQGLKWAEPADGAEADVVKDTAPVHQAATWTDFGLSLPARLKFALSVDIYEGPGGHGWHLTAYVRLDGRLFVRRWDGAGTESRARDWYEDKSEEV